MREVRRFGPQDAFDDRRGAQACELDGLGVVVEVDLFLEVVGRQEAPGSRVERPRVGFRVQGEQQDFVGGAGDADVGVWDAGDGPKVDDRQQVVAPERGLAWAVEPPGGVTDGPLRLGRVAVLELVVQPRGGTEGASERVGLDDGDLHAPTSSVLVGSATHSPSRLRIDVRPDLRSVTRTHGIHGRFVSRSRAARLAAGHVANVRVGVIPPSSTTATIGRRGLVIGPSCRGAGTCRPGRDTGP